MGAQGEVKVFSSMICTLFFINLIHSCIKSKNSNASVSSHQILVHFAVLLTSRYETKLSRDEINWFLMSKKSN